MKINWGTKIAILYCSFVVLIVILVFKSMNQKIELESKDYYAKELAYQSRINAIHKANAISQTIDYNITKNTITLSINKVFLSSDLKGDIFFYRPSSSDLDKHIPFNFDMNGQQTLPLDQFKMGIYEIEIIWKSNTTDYYKKIKIHIP